MRKAVLVVFFVVSAVVIGLSLFVLARPAKTVRGSHDAGVPAVVRPSAKPGIKISPQPPGAATGILTTTNTQTAGDNKPLNPSPLRPSNSGPELAGIPVDAEPLARVNGVDLTPGKVFPPGVMRSGDKMPKIALDKFLEEAVNRAVVVQEAERRGYAEDPDFTRRMDELRGDLAELPGLSPEMQAWQLNELRDRALMDRVYQAEGIVPRRLGTEEIESYYQAHSSEYEWVRKREALKGSPPEKIELRVMAEIRKDLQIPIKRQLSRQRDEFTAALRNNANVEILSVADAKGPD